MSLSSQDRQVLLILARQTITQVLANQDPPPVRPKDLSEDLNRMGASFVTLTLNDQLRGCIGSIEPRRPLALDVQENAVGAAFRDPRFPPLTQKELAGVQIEISVLTVPQPIAYAGAQDLLTKLRPHVDGVIVERGWHRATFLPQVWEKLPDPREFMANLCAKAGLPANAYAGTDLQVSTYQVIMFEEDRP